LWALALFKAEKKAVCVSVCVCMTTEMSPNKKRDHPEVSVFSEFIVDVRYNIFTS